MNTDCSTLNTNVNNATAMEIKTEVLINATPQKVWAILANFDNYSSWNPFLQSVKGELKVGCKLTVTIKQSEAKGTTFKPTVLTVEPARQLSWLGRLLIPGIFDGEHKFELFDNHNRTTTFRQSEKFSGILVSLFKKQLNSNTAAGFGAMNKKLKDLVEQK